MRFGSGERITHLRPAGLIRMRTTGGSILLIITIKNTPCFARGILHGSGEWIRTTDQSGMNRVL